MKRSTKRKIRAAIFAWLLLGGAAFGQFLGSIVFDPAQNGNALQQIAYDVQKLAKLDATVLSLTAQYNQIVTNARYFSGSIKSNWAGFGNTIVNNWTTPNYYGETAAWNPAVLFGTGSAQAWQNATLQLQRDAYLIGSPLGTSREMAYVATVNTFDGAGPATLQTLGNARVQQAQMAGSIARLQASALDGGAETNTEVQQLNLLSAASVQQLQMHQTTNNVMTSLLEQQTMANKVQRDAIADHMNFMNQVDQYSATEPIAWGNAAESISAYRLPQ